MGRAQQSAPAKDRREQHSIRSYKRGGGGRVDAVQSNLIIPLPGTSLPATLTNQRAVTARPLARLLKMELGSTEPERARRLRRKQGFMGGCGGGEGRQPINLLFRCLRPPIVFTTASLSPLLFPPSSASFRRNGAHYLRLMVSKLSSMAFFSRPLPTQPCSRSGQEKGLNTVGSGINRKTKRGMNCQRKTKTLQTAR